LIALIDAETGDTSQFTSITVSGDNTILASASAKRFGNYGFEFTFAGTSEMARASKSVGGYSTVYTRIYFKVLSGFAIAEADTIVPILAFAGIGIRLAFGVASSEGGTEVDKWCVLCGVDAEFFTNGFSLDEWHYVELLQIDGSPGTQKVYLDGELLWSKVGGDVYGLFAVRVSGDYGTPLADSVFYVDELQIDTEYIGPRLESEYSYSGSGLIRVTGESPSIIGSKYFVAVGSGLILVQGSCIADLILPVLPVLVLPDFAQTLPLRTVFRGTIFSVGEPTSIGLKPGISKKTKRRRRRR
jgi:hypothetical protein